MTFYRALIGFALSIALFFSFIPTTLAQSGGERIREFSATALLKGDRTLTITERITYDFGSGDRHGIFREIPTAYRRASGSYKLRLNLGEVTMDGASVPYSVTGRSPNFIVKIGDPDKTITGVHEYAITYETDRAINFFDGEGELYWNVTGNGWDVPIERAMFSFVGPAAYDAPGSRIACFTGPVGSTDAQCETTAQANTVQIRALQALNARDGLTVALRFPKGLIAEPTLAERIRALILDNWILATPLLAFAAMYWHWSRMGRDPKGRGTVIPQYEPPRGLAPIEMQALAKQSIAPSAITATIIDLARRGYLKIEFGEEKKLFGTNQTYAFQLVKPLEDGASPFEHSVFDGMFKTGDTVTLEDLKGKFYSSISKAKERAFTSLRQKGLFGRNPYGVRAAYLVVAAVIGVLAITVGTSLGAAGVVSLVVSAAIIAAFGWFMPSKTGEGAVALEEVEGFKWFLSVTEKDRLAFTDAPKLKPEQFHQFLPAAIALGVEEQWAKQFEGLNVPPPSYASGYGNWNTALFVHSMHSFNTAAAASAYVAPSQAGSGGSGFSGGGSGGGFGGGGGGSW